MKNGKVLRRVIIPFITTTTMNKNRSLTNLMNAIGKIVVLTVVISVTYISTAMLCGIYPHQLGFYKPMFVGHDTVLTVADGISYVLPTKLFIIGSIVMLCNLASVGCILYYLWYAVKSVVSYIQYKIRIKSGEVVEWN
jgi:uncharacterized membrane protein